MSNPSAPFPTQSPKSVQLPSWDVYYKFWTRGTCNTYANIPKYGDALASTIANGLKKQRITKRVVANRIASGWCNAYKMEREKETYDNYLWDFFYYWVGTRIKEDLKGYDFTTTMRTICDKLPESEAKNICTNKYPEINKDLFEKAKVLFDFFYNYGTAKIKLQEKGLFTNEKCNSSLKKVKDAYQNIRDICDGEGDSKSQYCEKLIQEYKVKFQNGAPLKLTCPGDPAQADQSEDDGSEHTEAEEEDEDDDYNDNDDEDDVEEEAVAADPGAAILPAVSGALATIGLPAVIFFLYKYTNLFSGIRNTFGGKSNRKKRSVRQELNAFSEDDTTDYFTIGSSSNLTVGDSADASTLYNEPSNRRGTNNNRGSRNNIAYHRM